MTTLLYQGHGSYRITANDGTCIYVDPFAGEGYDAAADLILVTHEHFDHTEVDKMPHADGCVIVRATDIHPAPQRYESVTIQGVGLTGVQAGFNENHDVDECAGFIVNVDGIQIYASGDTSMTDDMRSGKLAALGLDYALFCGDGFYNMGIDEASECAKAVDARHSIPVHLVPIDDPSDPTQLFDEGKAAAFDAPGKIVMRPGDEIELEGQL